MSASDYRLKSPPGVVECYKKGKKDVLPVNKVRDPLPKTFATSFAGERTLSAMNSFMIL